MQTANVEHIKEEKKVPNLRFPEFEGEWKKKRLGELCSTFKSGTGITSERISSTGRYPVFGGNGLRGYTNNFTHNGFYFLIGRQGALCGNINSVNGKSYISEHAIAAAANETSDTEWLAQRLEFYNLNRLSESSAQPGLAVNKLLRLKLVVPSKSEQQKIASFLSAVDQKIQQLTRKKELLEQYKKGVMQKIFSREIRFKDENGNDFPDWEEKRLGEIVDIITKGTTPTSIGFLYINSGVNFVKAENLSNAYSIIISSTPKISEECHVALSRSKLKENDILFSIAGTLGRTAIVKKSDLPANTNQALSIIRLRNNVDKLFVNYHLNNQSIRKKINQILSVGAQPNLSLKQVGDFKINSPSLPEQQKIASFLTSIDKKIEIVQTELTQTQKFKKGLLQQMFV